MICLKISFQTKSRTARFGFFIEGNLRQLVPKVEPLVEPADHSSDRSDDEHTFRQHTQAFATSGTLLRDGQATMMARWGREVHRRHHVHVCKAMLTLKARRIHNKTLQAMNLTIQLIRTLREVTRFAAMGLFMSHLVRGF